MNSASDDFDLSKHSFAHGLSKTAGEHLQVECSALVRDNEKAPEYSFAEVNGGKLQCKRVFFASCGKYAGEDSEKVTRFYEFSFVVKGSQRVQSITVVGQ